MCVSLSSLFVHFGNHPVNFSAKYLVFSLSKMSVNSLVSSHYGESVYGNMHTLNNSSFQHQIEVHQSEELEKQPSAPQNSTQNEALNFEFGVHLAEGSKRCYVSNFASMVELYEKIAQCFDISPKEVRLSMNERVRFSVKSSYLLLKGRHCNLLKLCPMAIVTEKLYD